MEENKDNSDDEIIGHRIRKKIKTSPKHTIDPKEFFQSNIQNQNDLVSQNVIPAENNNNLLYPNPLQIDHPINFQTQEKDAPGFYEDKPMISKIERNSYLETSDLRNFHNWIKSVMIKIYSEKLQTLLKQKKCDGKLSVLEIGCGQGGDLTKWAHSSIGIFVKKIP